MKKEITFSFLISCLITALLFSCSTEHKKKFTISCPDKSGQMRYYYETDKFTISKDGCIIFIPQEDSTQEYTICNNYDIERN